MNERTITAFHDEYYNAMPDTWENVSFRGVPVRKNPMDLWIYQELLYETKPHFIIETGTAYGGSASWFAHCSPGTHVISIDIIGEEHFPDRPKNSLITYVRGDTSLSTTVARVEGIMQVIEGSDAPWPNARVMVVLDSEHTQEHVRAELEIWPHLVTVGQYLVVEDTNITSKLAPQYQEGGPAEALADWTRFYPEFVADRSLERHGLTFNPGGWLRREEKKEPA